MASTPVTGSTSFANSDPRTQTAWSQRFFEFMLENMVYSSNMGTDMTSAIVKTSDLTVRKGGDVIYELQAPLTSNGVGDNDRLLTVDGSNTFNTEDLKVYNYKVEVHERAHGVQQGSAISNQRTYTDVKRDGISRLNIWAAEKLEDDIIAAVSGVGNVSQEGVVLNTETINSGVPTQNRYYAIGEASVSGNVEYVKIDGTKTAGITSATANLPLASFTVDAIGQTCRMSTKVIEFLHRAARKVITGTYGGIILKVPKLSPIKNKGRDMYTIYISRLQEKSLKADANWADAQKNANIRGDDNPIFTGMVALWDGVIIKTSERQQFRIGAGGVTATEYFNNFGATNDAVTTGYQVDRALFMGAQAGIVAYAKEPTRHASRIDIDRLDAVAVDMIYGTGKPSFNYFNVTSWATDTGTNIATEDYGVIVADTIVDPD